MRTIRVTPENAEGYLRWLRGKLLGVEADDFLEARRCGASLTDGLFTLVADEIPVSVEEQESVAAYEWLQSGRAVTAFLLRRIKGIILSLAVARVVGGLSDQWTGSRRMAARHPKRTAGTAA